MSALKYDSMRVLGLHSFGVASPLTGFNGTLAKNMMPAGKVGFLGQGGELLSALVNEEHSNAVGCSKFLSVGSQQDLGWEDCLNYLANDPDTECIGIYMEHLGDPRSFFLALRQAAARKPVVLLKGKPELTDQPLKPEIFEEACRCCGVLRVHRLADLFRMTSLLLSQPVAKGNSLAIVTNDRGPALLAANALAAAKGRLANWSSGIALNIAQALGTARVSENPVDLGHDFTPDQLAEVACLGLRNSDTDALLVVVSPQEAVDPVSLAERLRDVVATSDKPVLASWMWGAANPESLAVLRGAGIPICYSPEAAIRIFSYLWEYYENRRCLEEIRCALEETQADNDGRVEVTDAISDARGSGQLALTEDEARSLFLAYGLPVQREWEGTKEEEAAEAAEDVGYPVLMEFANDWQIPKIPGECICFRASNSAELRRTWRTLNMIAREQFQIQAPARVSLCPIYPDSIELVLTSKVEGDLGPVICLRQSGSVATTQDQGRMVIAPLTPATARQLISQIPSVVRASQQEAKEADECDKLVKFLLDFSQLVVDQPGIREINVPSLRVRKNEVVACAPEVVLHAPEANDQQLPFLVVQQK